MRSVSVLAVVCIVVLYGKIKYKSNMILRLNEDLFLFWSVLAIVGINAE
jgi:hypothetical protein